jgi:hypothetical protein
MSFTGNLGVTHGGIFIAHSHGLLIPQLETPTTPPLQPPRRGMSYGQLLGTLKSQQ